MTLSQHRWSLAIIAELGGAGGSRFVPLANRLSASRDAVRQTLDALREAGLVMPNPGYGHPSRPEYILTAHGERIAPACTKLLRELRRRGVEDVVLKKWSMPILVALGDEIRYGELRRALGATPRALTITLKELGDRDLVERRVHTGFPPSTTYRVAAKGRGVRRRVVALATAL
jgi:DNA-binding HxlR family transcriptional regulator